MCGIAGIIHRGGETGRIGEEITEMLQAMKHRGPDSTGFAFYGEPRDGEVVLRLVLAEQESVGRGFDIFERMKTRDATVKERVEKLGGVVVGAEEPREYARQYRITYGGELRRLADYIEDIEGVKILSMGSRLELIKDLGDAREVSGQYQLDRFEGTHAIGHVRMATESDVDIRSAHPYWAYPFNDVCVVHNGQLTNYWSMRRDMERGGHRFVSDCDSELIAVYVADKLNRGESLEAALRDSIDDLDGVFTYLVATSDGLGMAKDTMAAKPMVLYESEKCIVIASEEVAIRSVVPYEVDTVDPYAGEVRVWQN
jgi:glutamate synthase domain-containing protein 1